MQNIGQGVIKNLLIALPPFEEQKRIVKFLQNATSKLSDTILKAENEIQLMQEYRTRLISDVVTGKIDVRDIPVESSTDPDVMLDDGELDEEEALEGEEELAYAAD